MERRVGILKKHNKYKKLSNIKKNEDNWDEEKSTESVTNEDNHIYFYDDVNTSSILALIKIIKDLNYKLGMMKYELELKYKMIVHPNIILHINSNGGNIIDALAAVDKIKSSKIPIISIVEGMAASAATFL